MLEKDFTRIPNNYIRTQKYLSGKAVKVMNYICSCVNSNDAKEGDEKAFPSLETIAENCGFSRPTVSRMIKELVMFRLLNKERRFNKSTIYRIGMGLDDEEEMIRVHGIVRETIEKRNKKLDSISNGIVRETLIDNVHETQCLTYVSTNNTNELNESNQTNKEENFSNSQASEEHPQPIVEKIPFIDDEEEDNTKSSSIGNFTKGILNKLNVELEEEDESLLPETEVQKAYLTRNKMDRFPCRESKDNFIKVMEPYLA